MSSLQQLVETWRQDAEAMRRNACDHIAAVIDRHIAQLEAAARSDGEEALTLVDAARESGYSVDRLRHMVSEGRVKNVGRKGAPRVRRQDLPKKSSRGSSFDPEQVARRMLAGGAQ